MKKERSKKKPAGKKKRAVKLKPPLALLSVTNKDGLPELARALIAIGIEIVSTGGTRTALQEAGVPCTPIEKITGFPEILDGRVKTINPLVAAGILAKKTDAHQQELDKRRIRRFTYVVVNLYQFQATVARPGVTREDAIENIDIGGPSLLRAAAKNADAGLVVICDPADYQWVIDELKAKGEVSLELRHELAQKVFDLTARYDAAIYAYLTKDDPQRTTFSALQPVVTLRKGESGAQSPAVLCRDIMAPDHPLAWHHWQFVAGMPGYVNLCGGDRALWVMCRLIEAFRRNFENLRQSFGRLPYIAIACKRGNPCGLGVDSNWPDNAIQKAMMGDPAAVMGAEVMTNFPIKADQAVWLNVVPKERRPKVGRSLWGPDVVFAPSFSEAAVDLLTAREQSRVLMANPALVQTPWPLQQLITRPVFGDTLAQPAPNFVLEPAIIEECLGFRWEGLSRDDKADLLIAWVVAWEGVSNSIALAKDMMLIGTGLGQQDRRGATKLAITRAQDAGHDPRGAYFASDGFFPFAEAAAGSQLPEATEMLKAIGCVGGVVPADGKHWPEVKRFLLDSGMRVAALKKEFRGFRWH